MTKCEICSAESNIESTGTMVSGGLKSGRTSRGAGNFCMNCMMQIAQDRNYPLLYQARQQQQKGNPKKIAFLFFGHFDYATSGNEYHYIPVAYAQQYLKKFGKKDQIIVILLTDSYDKYYDDTPKRKGIHNLLQNACKKTQIDYYMVNFLSHKLRSEESIISYFNKILSDFIHLVGHKDQFTLLLTDGMPLNMDFVQLWVKEILETKNVSIENFVYSQIDHEQTMFMEIQLKEKFRETIGLKPEAEINSGFVTSFHNYMKHYLRFDSK